MKKQLHLTLSLAFTILFFLPTYSQEFGIQLYSLRDYFRTDIENSLKTISDWGITTVEGGDTYGMDETKFRNLLSKYNLETISIGADYEELKNNPKAVAEKAKRYGARFVMCAWIPHNGNRFTIDDIKASTAVFNRAGNILKKEGITLAYHAHGYEFRPHEYGTLFDYMAQNAKNFSFEMDVFWVQHGGETPLLCLKNTLILWSCYI